MTKRIVLKVGGSVLLQPTAMQSLNAALTRKFRDHQVNLFFGGANVVDALRQLDALYQFDQEKIHWLCLDALELTCNLAQSLLCQSTMIGCRQAFASHRTNYQPGAFLIAPKAFYDQSDRDELPCSWRTTSDSIAALLAKRLLADELVLIKSCILPKDLTVSDAVAEGIVDESFLEATANLRVRFCNVDDLVF